MNVSIFRKTVFVISVCLFGILGCRGVDSDSDSNSGGELGDDLGELTLWITDGPVDEADMVELSITGVQVKPVGADSIDVLLDSPLIVDLLDLGDEDNPREEIIDDHSFPVGDYEWIRLLLDEADVTIMIDGLQYPLTIPPDEQDGLQFEFNLTVEDDTDLDLTIDLDLRKSLRSLGGNQYELHPRLRIVNTEQTGTLNGTVAQSLVEDNDDCNNGAFNDEGNAVYVFAGGDAVFQDIRDNAQDPIATTTVEKNFDNEYVFRVGFLPRGSYTAVFTCDGSIDDPETDNELIMLFSDHVNVSIQVGETTTIDFEAD
ncbi:MAG: DUF4382 domain-containing protein [Cellvibrionaceae bacterium]